MFENIYWVLSTVLGKIHKKVILEVTLPVPGSFSDGFRLRPDQHSDHSSMRDLEPEIISYAAPIYSARRN